MQGKTKKVAEILKPYLDDTLRPFEKLQGDAAKIDEWEVDGDNKIVLAIKDIKGISYEYKMEKVDLEDWLIENFGEPFDNIEEPISASQPISEIPSKGSINFVRDNLIDIISKLKNNEIDVKRATAISNISQTWLNSFRLEMDYIKMSKRDSKIKQLDN